MSKSTVELNNTHDEARGGLEGSPHADQGLQKLGYKQEFSRVSYLCVRLEVHVEVTRTVARDVAFALQYVSG
jgi:hypothetical protein